MINKKTQNAQINNSDKVLSLNGMINKKTWVYKLNLQQAQRENHIRENPDFVSYALNNLITQKTSIIISTNTC